MSEERKVTVAYLKRVLTVGTEIQTEWIGNPNHPWAGIVLPRVVTKNNGNVLVTTFTKGAGILAGQDVRLSLIGVKARKNKNGDIILSQTFQSLSEDFLRIVMPQSPTDEVLEPVGVEGAV